MLALFHTVWVQVASCLSVLRILTPDASFFFKEENQKWKENSSQYIYFFFKRK